MECSECGTDDFSYCHKFTTISGVRRKKAVICGISYRSTTRGRFRVLNGCIEDVNRTKNVLVWMFQFPESNIRLLIVKFGRLTRLLNIQSCRLSYAGSSAGTS